MHLKVTVKSAISYLTLLPYTWIKKHQGDKEGNPAGRLLLKRPWMTDCLSTKYTGGNRTVPIWEVMQINKNRSDWLRRFKV